MRKKTNHPANIIKVAILALTAAIVVAGGAPSVLQLHAAAKTAGQSTTVASVKEEPATPAAPAGRDAVRTSFSLSEVREAPKQPEVTPEPEPVATPEPEPVAVPEPEPVVTPEPEPVAVPEPEPVAVPEPEPVVTEPAVDPNVNPHTGRVPIETYPAATPEVAAAVDQIIAANLNPGMSEFEMVAAINQYLCATVTYDYSYTRYRASDALFSGSAVCQGYANAFWRIMNRAGIPTDYVSGIGYTASGSGSHGWNRCYIGGVYYYVDVTWNDQGSYSNNRYLLISYEQMSADHAETEINRNRGNDYTNPVH